MIKKIGIYFLLIIPGIVGASTPLVVNEWFFTSRNLEENVDSTAVWHGPSGEHWMLTTTKSTHSILVEDATNGAFIRRLGGYGNQLGQFSRPNGVFVADHFLFVVERDNARVQVFNLPNLLPLGSFGEDVLKYPYGLYVTRNESDWVVYVTDNYETMDEEVPPNEELDRRVVVFDLEIEGTTEGSIDGEFRGYIGETKGDGVLRVVESIYGDPENNRLLIAEEDTDHATCGIKIYDMAGSFTGKILGKEHFSGQPEGIAFVDHGDGQGMWILTDQSYDKNRYHVYDRKTLEYKGTFQGRYTSNTDGVWFSPHPMKPRFPKGIFYAVHNDGNVAAFAWHEVLEGLEE